MILDHLGDILNARGRVAEAVESWQRALEGEDEEGELDRTGRGAQDPRRPGRPAGAATEPQLPAGRGHEP